MSRLALPLTIVACVLLALALTWWVLARDAPGPTGMTEQDLAAFQRIDLAGNAEVTLRQGSAERLSVETPARGVIVTADVRNGTVYVVVRDNRRWWNSLFGGNRRPTRLTLAFRSLDAVSLSGAVSLTASALDAPELRLTASGGTSVRIAGLRTRLLYVSGNGALKSELAGTATEQRVSISGAGEYDAERLSSESANVSVSGVGRVLVNVSRTLDAEISGAGTIEYLGDPVVRERVSGVGRIRRRSAGAPGWSVQFAGL